MSIHSKQSLAYGYYYTTYTVYNNKDVLFIYNSFPQHSKVLAVVVLHLLRTSVLGQVVIKNY